MPRAAVIYRFENKAGPYLEAVRAAGAEPVGITPDRPVDSLNGFGGWRGTGNPRSVKAGVG